MSAETRVYPLRRSRSPSRQTTPTMTRRKLKSKETDQETFDSVNVTTYNDNPKHLYGLDKHLSEMPPNLRVAQSPRTWSQTNGHVEREEKLVGGSKSANHKAPKGNNNFIHNWHQAVIFVACVILVCEGVIWIHKMASDTWKDETLVSKEMDDSYAVKIESLLSQMKAQKNFIQEFNDKTKSLKQNCSCEEKVTVLQNEDSEQKALINQLQEQILMTVNVVKSMNKKLEDVQKLAEEWNNREEKKKNEEESSLCKGEDCKLSSQDIYPRIQSAIEVYHADVLGLPDFALESAGGRVHTPHHSETCNVGAPIIKIFGLPFWQDPRSPRSIITADNLPGNCWSMKGTAGYIVIQLATSIEPTMVTLEHLDKRLDQYSKDAYQSAPKDFDVYAWLDNDGKGKIKLGSYSYLREQSAIQTFKVQTKVSKPILYVELKIQNNYGNTDCTCIYRFRVHGISYTWHRFAPEGGE